MKAQLVFDYSSPVRIPDSMGLPRNDQMRGSDAEQLTEVCGRICYDSLGQGRNSLDYHQHIVQVNHGSVLEHYNITLELPTRMNDFFQWMMNRPGVWIRPCSTTITLNLRALLEWEKMGESPDDLKHGLRAVGCLYAPMIFGQPVTITGLLPQVVAPEYDEECWVSLYLSGSRGFSHEMVRHGDWTAISQRSTRYCDESLSDWITHPMLNQYTQETNDGELATAIDELIADSRSVYCVATERIHKWLMSKGVTGTDARKQARGAARGFLGNALETEMIFSANVAQWKRILRQRGGPAADAEIRQIACLILIELKKSQYSSKFDDFNIVSGDFGQSVLESV